MQPDLPDEEARPHEQGEPSGMAPTASVAPVRDTRQRRAIRLAFEEAERPLSTEQLHAVASRESRGLGLATVYRSIKSLVDEGWLEVIDIPGHGAFYERAGKEHHHHFACENCSEVTDLDGCSSEVRVRLPRGYRARGHDVTIFGTCSRCAEKRRPPTRRGR
ncbi:MAG: ferric uptake regulator, Fur family [Candidatus Eremiobacteraeota bacterium]|nr:ferric uptake regulator, Fur family [Candidatus Eremiobacteraeota bacterium]